VIIGMAISLPGQAGIFRCLLRSQGGPKKDL
jgi:hypothetical protein